MTDRIFRKMFFIMALGLVVGLGGCEAFSGDDDDDNDVKVRKDERISRDREGDRGRADGSQYNPRVPESATLMNQWVNNELSFRSTSDGMVYILNENNDLVYSGRIGEDDRFVFDRREGQVSIDGRTVFSRNEAGAQKYRVFFDRR